MMAVIHSFEEVFAQFKESGYKIPQDTTQLQAGIEWYNNNLSLIALAHTCPMVLIEEITLDTYMWAYASGLIACAHMNTRINQTTFSNMKYRMNQIK